MGYTSVGTGLLSWWGLHDADWLDSSGNGKTLTLFGTVGNVAGLLGNAANFTAQGNLLYIQGTVVKATPFSMSCWCKASSIANNPSPMAQCNNAVQWQCFTVLANGTVNVRSGFGAAGNVSSAVGLFTLNAWHLLTMTHDGTILRGYLDGVLVASAAKNFANSALTIAIGDSDSFPGSNQFWPGQVGMAGTWGRALTDGGVSVGQMAGLGSDIYNLYNNGAALDFPFFLPDPAVSLPSPEPTNTGACRNKNAPAGFTWLPADDCPVPTV